MSVRSETPPALAPIAFVFALILAPIVVAVLFFWLFLIPVFAVYFGAIPYLLFGTPVLLWMVTHTRITFWNCALGGLLAQMMFAWSISADFTPSRLLGEPAEFFILWGIPFSVAWCGTFA